MTEAEWLTCDWADPMVKHCWPQVSRRKVRLLGCACSCRICHLAHGADQADIIKALHIAEQAVDEPANEQLLAPLLEKMQNRVAQQKPASKDYQGTMGILMSLWGKSTEVIFIMGLSSLASSPAWAMSPNAGYEEWALPEDAKWQAAWTAERTAQADLVRHLFGNPFRAYPTPDSWPSTVHQLADALYSGEECGFALHDALLDAGHTELADHFTQERHHPKGCWALDLILGKS